MRPVPNAMLCVLAALCALTGCDAEDGKDGAGCTVTQLDEGARISCDDGSEATLPNPAPGEPCSVSENDGGVTVSCPDGTSAQLPGSAGGSCTVTEQSDGSITIRCPDGSSAVIPAPGSTTGDGGTLLQLTGAANTACGACHDSDANRVHYQTMTAWVNGQPHEDCVSCHKESGIASVSSAHARPEFGPPGFQVQILGVDIDSSTRAISVELSIQDDSGRPLDRTGVSSTFLVASAAPIVPVGGTTPIAGPYVSYLTRETTQLDNPDFPLNGPPRVVQQPVGENNGTYTELGAGHYRYTFAATLPAGFRADVTHVVSHYTTRTVGPVRWVSNDAYFFVPADPQATPLRRAAVQTATCNGCHDPLSAHGGSRQEIQVCLGCHSQGAVDPESNNSIDLNVMVHRIHMGAQLPSVQAGGRYAIVGRNNETDDFSHVHYPREIVECQSCHTDSDDERWVTNGERQACMSCHDDIYEAGVHPFGLAEDALCGNGACHGPGGSAPDAREAHVTFLNSDAPIFDISILSASVADPDAAPAVTVRALTGTRLSGATVPVTSVDSLATLNVFLNGPNSDFARNGHDIEQYGKSSLVDLVASDTPGEFSFLLPETLRAAAGSAGDPATDSYTLSIRAAYDPTPGASPDDDRVDMLKNPTIAIAAAGEPVGRLAVVDTAKCNACHGDLRAHGGDILARNVEECIMCHTASLETSPRQGANLTPGPTTTLRFSKLVHRIHAGSAATEPYIVYGYASAAPYPEVDFSSLGFPGDLRDCSSCHLDDTYLLPVQASPSATETLVLDDAGNPLAF